MPRVLLVSSLVGAVLLYSANRLAGIYFLYWRIWWLDIPMHALGGLTVGLLGAWAIETLSRQGWVFSRATAYCSLASFVLVVGCFWEFVEYLIGYTFNTIGSYRWDTVKDVAVDLAGGSLAFWFYWPARRRPVSLS